MEDWRLTELPSGERVISQLLPHVRSAALGYWIGAGSRDETESDSGVSHFIEHMLFKGTSAYTALEIAEIFDGLGGELNAATSKENTLVYARVPDDQVETALDVMSDMVFAPQFSDLDAEREVVLEEIAMYEDTPQDQVHDLFATAVFGAHPLGRPVIGTAEVISTVTVPVLQAYHRAMYSPENIVFAASGNVDHDQLVELVERAATARTHGGNEPKAGYEAPDGLKPAVRFQQKDTEQYHVCLGAPGIARSDPRRFAASILDAILGGSASSRLFQEIREKRGMAYSVYSFLSEYADTGQIGFYVGTREDNLAEALTIAAAQIADIASGGIVEGELERAKQNLKGRVLLSLESTTTHMNRLGNSLISGTEILTHDQILGKIDAVDAAQVSELAATLLDPETLSAAGIGPDEGHFLQAVEQVVPATRRAA